MRCWLRGIEPVATTPAAGRQCTSRSRGDVVASASLRNDATGVAERRRIRARGIRFCSLPKALRHSRSSAEGRTSKVIALLRPRFSRTSRQNSRRSNYGLCRCHHAAAQKTPASRTGWLDRRSPLCDCRASQAMRMSLRSELLDLLIRPATTQRPVQINVRLQLRQPGACQIDL
jgi:hypothetical protein